MDIEHNPKPHAEYEHKPGLRDKLVFTEDLQIFVNEIHKRDMDVQSEISEIRRWVGEGSVSVRFALLSQIEAIYSQGPIHVASNGARVEDSAARQDYSINLMKKAMRLGASDIHMVVIGNKAKIQFRIHGELHTDSEVSAEEGTLMMSSLYNSMVDSASDPNFDQTRRQQGRLRKVFADKAGIWSGRLATTPAEGGVAMALRLLYKRRTGRPSSAELGYLSEQVKILNDTRHRGKGICILSGGTGSGKSTTLECQLSELIEETFGKRRVLTIEHPVEFPIHDAVQTPIVDKNGLDDDGVAAEFALAITHSMRLDPDVMMVGEIRSPGSARAAFAAAMTGHGMYTTIHANDWLTVFDRLRDLGITDSLLFDPTLVRCIVNQSLARTICPHCRVSFNSAKDTIDKELRKRVEEFCEPEKVYMRGTGCTLCLKGVNGRTVIAEVASPTRGLMEAYQESKFAAYDYWLQHGGITKCSHLIQRINEGLIDPMLGELDVCLLDTDRLLKE